LLVSSGLKTVSFSYNDATMIQIASLIIGIRYTYARRGNHFTAFVSLAAIASITLGLIVLITIASIMNGFEEELRDRVLGVEGHLVVQVKGMQRKELAMLQLNIEDSQERLFVWPVIAKDVLLEYEERVTAIRLMGVDDNFYSALEGKTFGSNENTFKTLADGSFNLVVGNGLAVYFGLTIGDKLIVMVPQQKFTVLGAIPRLKKFTVSGIYESASDMYSEEIFANLADVSKLFKLGYGADELHVRIAHAEESGVLADQIRTISRREVADWSDTHSVLFRALKTEKFLMSFILVLASSVAMFSVFAILLLGIEQKKEDISILFAMGMQPTDIMSIFLIQGSLVSIIGIVLGVSLGCLCAANVGDIVSFFEEVFHFHVFSPEVYYTGRVPSLVIVEDVILFAGIAGLVAILGTIYPSIAASRAVRAVRS
jgi:lipoprotein-releasing system permease protein